jgi:hypothetical protein
VEGGVGGETLLRGGEEELHAAGGAGGGGTEVDDLGGAAAMDEAGGAGIAQALRGARAGAEAAVEAAAAVGHRGLAAAGAGARGGAAARCGAVVASRVAVLQLAATLSGSGVQLGRLGLPLPAGFLGLSFAALVGGLLGGVGLGEVLRCHFREGIEPVGAGPGPGAAVVAAGEQGIEPLQGERAADHPVLGTEREIASAHRLLRAAPADRLHAGIGGLGLGEIVEVADLRHRPLLDAVAGRDLVMEEGKDGLERRPILAALLADHVGMGLDGELVGDQASMRKRFLPAFRHGVLPDMEEWLQLLSFMICSSERNVNAYRVSYAY